MIWLENAYYAFSIVAISLQILLLIVLTVLIIYSIWKVRQLQSKVKSLTPMFILSNFFGGFLGKYFSNRRRR